MHRQKLQQWAVQLAAGLVLVGLIGLCLPARASSAGEYVFYFPHVQHDGEPRRLPRGGEFANQWALNTPPGQGMQVPEAWYLSTGSSNVRVGVIANGIANHPEWVGRLVDLGGPAVPDLQSKIVRGTHLAGIVAASGEDGQGMAGWAWNVKLYNLWNSPDGDVGTHLVEALQQAQQISPRLQVLLIGVESQFKQMAVQAEIDTLDAQGVLMIVPIGNFTPPGDSSCTHTSRIYDHTLVVSAVDANDQLADFSRSGPGLDVVAPGMDILSAAPNGDYESVSGTEQAAAQAAGLAALIYSRYPGYTAQQVRTAILCNADDLGAPGRDDVYGYGRINAWRALRYGASVNCLP